jgi:hypothetical protein
VGSNPTEIYAFSSLFCIYIFLKTKIFGFSGSNPNLIIFLKEQQTHHITWKISDVNVISINRIIALWERTFLVALKLRQIRNFGKIVLHFSLINILSEIAAFLLRNFHCRLFPLIVAQFAAIGVDFNFPIVVNVLLYCHISDDPVNGFIQSLCPETFINKVVLVVFEHLEFHQLQVERVVVL